MNDLGSSPPQDFTFSILRIRPSLFDSTKDISIAVVVQSDNGVCIIGRDPSGAEAISPIAAEILQALPELLQSEIARFLEQAPAKNVIDSLALSDRSNVILSPPSTVQSHFPLQQTAFVLFAEHVAGLQPTRGRPPTKPKPALRRDMIFQLSAAAPSLSTPLPLAPVSP